MLVLNNSPPTFCRLSLHATILGFSIFIFSNYTPRAEATNLVANGSFEIILSDWSYDGSLDIRWGLNNPVPPAAHGSNYLVLPEYFGVVNNLRQDIITVPGESYYVRFSSRAGSGAPTSTLRFGGQEILMTDAPNIPMTLFWKVLEGTAVATNSVTRLEFVNQGYIDDVRVIALHEPVQILTQPIDRSVISGGTASFSVGADGGPPIFYSWWFNDSPLPHATNATLTLTSVDQANAGSYSVVVSNISGSLTSAVATLLVEPLPEAPLIVSQPTGDTFAAGYAYTLSVVALGTPPLQYQWSFNGIEIPAQTDRVLTFPSIDSTNAGVYAVLVQNQSGSVLSLPATLVITNGQGGARVQFGNMDAATRRVIYDVDGITPLNFTNFVAQLYVSISTTLRPVGIPRTFRGGILAGYFDSRDISIPDLLHNQPVNVQTRVWEVAAGPSYEDARARGGKFGSGPVFSILGINAPNNPQKVPMVSFSLQAGLPIFTTGKLEVNAHSPGQPIEWKFTGISGARYLIEKRNPPADWVPLMILSNSTGTAFFTDTNATTQSINFYRSRILD